VTLDYFYNDSWQVVEVRKDGAEDPLEQYVWDVRYVDAPVLRDRDTDDDGVMDETLYYTNDANFNVTAVVDADTGDVVERYVYDPYGKVTILDGQTGGQTDWAADENQVSDVDNAVLYTGQRFDGESALYLFRNRYHDPSLGRFISRDPIGYFGGMNLYSYASARAVDRADPMGLFECPYHVNSQRGGFNYGTFEGALKQALMSAGPAALNLLIAAIPVVGQIISVVVRVEIIKIGFDCTLTKECLGTCIFWNRDHRCLYDCKVTEVRSRSVWLLFLPGEETKIPFYGHGDELRTPALDIGAEVLVDKKEGCQNDCDRKPGQECPWWGFSDANTVKPPSQPPGA
jgi:RHS repeat-associated protein